MNVDDELKVCEDIDIFYKGGKVTGRVLRLHLLSSPSGWIDDKGINKKAVEMLFRDCEQHVDAVRNYD